MVIEFELPLIYLILNLGLLSTDKKESYSACSSGRTLRGYKASRSHQVKDSVSQKFTFFRMISLQLYWSWLFPTAMLTSTTWNVCLCGWLSKLPDPVRISSSNKMVMGQQLPIRKACFQLRSGRMKSHDGELLHNNLTFSKSFSMDNLSYQPNRGLLLWVLGLISCQQWLSTVPQQHGDMVYFQDLYYFPSLWCVNSWVGLRKLSLAVAGTVQTPSPTGDVSIHNLPRRHAQISTE